MGFVVYFLVEVLLVLVLLGYFTLLERKILGYGQLRKGPNKAVLWGLMQPLLDGLKLFMKGFWGESVSGLFSMWGSPSMGLFLVLCLWFVLGAFWGSFGLGFVLFYVVLLASLVGVSFFVSGYLTGGKYSMVGSVRNLAQVVSYEGVMVVGLLVVMLYSSSGSALLSLSPVLGSVVFLFLLVAVVMESNRTPVDFVEGESELVSGLATEMGGLSFSLLFMMEYGVMSFYSVLLSLVIWGVSGWAVAMLSAMVMVVFLVLLRLSLPRSRYDMNMLWGWKISLVSVFLWFLLGFALMVE
uniref:NADH dehydrogenase subunit 1 n=1 Tax=Bolbosoma nipponicum TaxID=1167864 RepID=UPI002E78C634|nr:NADH dehydrogenase subunit 1 [Bolbosoma nipponicum]WPN89837.1 NADH dehydrogenase subunit 1 [Bolbosoma nipponicum]